MVKFRENIPNAITVCNLICGCIACLYAARGSFLCAAGFIVLGAIFDLFDGLVARLLHNDSALGRELDSLADLVTFGLAPGLIMQGFLVQALQAQGQAAGFAWLFLCLPVATAIRLARFNLGNSDSSVFIGLPSPASGLIVCTLPLVARFPDRISALASSSPFFLSCLILLLAGMMLSGIPMLSLKFKSRSWQQNRARYLFLILSAGSCLLGIPGVFLIILLYFTLSVSQKRLQ